MAFWEYNFIKYENVFHKPISESQARFHSSHEGKKTAILLRGKLKTLKKIMKWETQKMKLES